MNTSTLPPGERITAVRLSSCYLPLAHPVGDAEVLTGRQKPMTEIAMLSSEVGQPDRALDIRRVEAVRQHLGDAVPIMVDATPQWDRPTAQFDTPIATGEMLTRAAEHGELIRHRAADCLRPDALRVGGITPFLKITAQAEQAGLMLGPHVAMELHVHLAAAYPSEPWVEHFDGLEPLFNERLDA